MVVIAIIAILAAILFPVFARARENARKSSCMSNMKQLGLGIMQYTQDFDEMFPQGNPNDYYTAGWAKSIWPYVKSKPIFACPNDPTKAPQTVDQIVSYGMNDSILGDQNNGRGASLSAFNAPTLTIMLCETQNNWLDPSNVANAPYGDDTAGATCSNNFWGGKPGPGGGLDSYATGPIPNQTVVTTAWPEGRHLAGSNWLAVDGHVKWLKGTAISGGKDAPNSTSAEVPNNTAAGTDNMRNGTAALTFSKK